MKDLQNAHGRVRSAALVAVCSLVLGACSSTNQRGSHIAAIDDVVTAEQPAAPTPPTDDEPTDGQVTSIDPSEDASSAPGTTPGSPSAEPAGGGDQGVGSGSDEGETSGSAGGTPKPSGSNGSGGTKPEQGPAGPVAMGKGVTEDSITIGMHVTADLQAGFAAIGASGDPADESQISRVLVDWVNATGGIRGRELKAVYHETDATNGSWASQAQAACSTFTEDNTTFAVVDSAVGGDDSMLACMAQKDTPLVALNMWLYDEPYRKANRGILYRPGRMEEEVWVREYVDGLDRIGFFDGATVGLLRFDDPVFDRLANNVLLPRLKALGLEVSEQVVGSPGSLADFGSAGSQMGSAVLRFRADGVTHVLMLENAGIMPFFFMKEAEAQGFRPTYGLSSTDIPSTQAGQQAPAQLNGSVGIGWTPPNDVYNGDHPGGNANYELCRKIMTEGGVTNLSGFYIQSRCDSVFFLREALERAPALTKAGLLAGVEALGSDYTSPFTMGSSFRANKYDGADVFRVFAYAVDCECFRYSGPPTRRK